jgi:NAD(P)-dependent dehydrogenase (short-subunit alcohol dehydrogenase family)
MSTQLQGKNILVTGGFGILGRALGALLTARGARVALLDRTPAPADVAAHPGLLAVGEVDLVDAAAAAAAFDHIAAQLGGIHAVVNVAGGFCWETIESGSIASWDRMYEMNLRTAVLSSQAALPHLLLASSGGRIVNIGALASLKAGLGMGAYAASKSGLARFTEALAEELKDRGVTVNAVLPSIIDTPANRADMPQADASRWVTPPALAAVIAFLLSDDAAPISGACLLVGGRV